MAAQTAWHLMNSNLMPKALIVGISYPNTSFQKWFTGRTRDLTPTRYPKAEELFRQYCPDCRDLQTGGAPIFLKFINEELIPFISKNYHVAENDNTLFGGSLGGLFALYTLFQSPETFQRYIIGSPSIWWDGKILFEYEDTFSRTHSDISAKIFLSVGALEELMDENTKREIKFEMVSNFREMATRLNTKRYPNLELDTVIFDDEVHSSVFPATISRGLRMVFRSK